MKKYYKKIIISIIILILTVSFVNSAFSNKEKEKKELKLEDVIKEVIVLKTCDGVEVQYDCELDDVIYSKYVYHPPVEEQSHSEQKLIGYTKEITGYCTLCRDGTYSPSCATGRGACSHHGGVAQWNAPIYRDVPQYEQVKVVDVEASDEWYETIIK